ncbi:MAG: 1,4-dihydroxy-2-naphthoate polyprenyltransferase [Cyclobacteriaceae bacterium]
MANFKAWIHAARPRTLPLALASISMGGFLAAADQAFNPIIFGLCILTTLLLQILSNLANDYGDAVHGIDHEDREGPSRAVQAGTIGSNTMKRAIVLFTFLALVSGLALLYLAFGFGLLFFSFLALGLLAIGAAITYTAGGSPYGHLGLGDLSVILFFGPVAVLGTYFLQTQTLNGNSLWPALSCGLFATAVLNVNNIRDIPSDQQAGKRSIPVRLGREKAVLYHWALLAGGLLCSVVYVVLNFHSFKQWAFLIVLPLLVVNGLAVKNKDQALALDPYLKQMALTTLLYVLSFGLGLIW